jgi:hypothetical protein
MAAPYLGGLRITSLRWTNPTAIRADFVSTYGNLYQYQLYAGRTLIGSTVNTNERFIAAPVGVSLWPQFFAVLAVDPDNVLTDYGPHLPPRPYNKAEVSITTSGWPSDSRLVAIAWADEPGEAVNYANEVRQLFYTDGSYTLTSEPIGPSGDYTFAAYGIDDKPENGNRGSVTSLTATLTTQPPDFALATDGARFQVTATSGTATITYDYQER